ncbi:MAG TPA: mechanosensitive ion channel family protein [Acidimicrobiales bacterium]|nr:mechanosensitive ion channel family protein [Acidimicrobiales bacterium]
MILPTIAAFRLTAQAAAGNRTVTDRGFIHQIFVDLGVSDARAHTLQVYLAGPLRIALIVLIAVILSRLVTRLARRFVNGLRLVSPLVRTTPRGADRVRTLTGVFASLLRVVIWIVAVLTVLGQLSINLAPFIATATVVGAAVGFGAQSLVKDFLSGALILIEDQYGVGDHVVIGTGVNAISGTVESVNLRITRLRSLEGGVLYVPNGDIRALANDAETDSQAVVDVVVPLGTDLPAAGRAAEAAARELAAEPAWAETFKGEPMFAGVQSATDAGVTIRVLALTGPGQHFRAARELRLRILERLRRDHLAWAPPEALEAAAAPTPVPVANGGTTPAAGGPATSDGGAHLDGEH